MSKRQEKREERKNKFYIIKTLISHALLNAAINDPEIQEGITT